MKITITQRELKRMAKSADEKPAGDKRYIVAHAIAMDNPRFTVKVVTPNR